MHRIALSLLFLVVANLLIGDAEQPESGQQFISATNVIFHDYKRPSALILPIVPGK
jgi:predicted acyl esterase